MPQELHPQERSHQAPKGAYRREALRVHNLWSAVQGVVSPVKAQKADAPGCEALCLPLLLPGLQRQEFCHKASRKV